MSRDKVSPHTVERLSQYLRALRDSLKAGEVQLSSADIARKSGTTAAQVRKDLSFFGSFGKKGYGYDVFDLIDTLEAILGVDKRWKVALVGFGRLGQSIALYKGLPESGFDICAIFEKDPDKIGGSFRGVEIYGCCDLLEVCEERGILLAIAAVPPEAAEEVFQRLLDAGIRGILNFTGHTGFKPPPHAFVKDMNMAAEMEFLSYYVSHH